ncbi:fibronectin type 3 and ankyrin repeat domains protein 1-like isoform X1 [Haliotis rufescens]|uniref:fibronectin type 3 and ankyrin repeat domains protein 1-like isoform X1 n=1 Tax=Haliotis rufescens TaxID=6454 RepID=UPI001EAFC004|nr:fibronectin type 3 and ankyrin repeat domains protein 1-like isoform X1 [Haliotis rufescens]
MDLLSQYGCNSARTRSPWQTLALASKTARVWKSRKTFSLIEVHKTPEPYVLSKPAPPVVGKVTHHTIELYWDDAYDAAVEVGRGQGGKIRTCIQELDRHSQWGNIYTGYAKRHTVTGLDAQTTYTYRIRFQHDEDTSEWSAHTAVSTTKEPLTGEHLHRAVIRKDLRDIEKILQSGDVSVDVPDKYGFSALMQASQKGLIDIVQLLLDHGADIHLKTDAGKTCLMLSCFTGQLEVVKLLRKYNAQYDDFDRGGSTALHWAADGGNVKLIDWMIHNGADVNMRDHHSGWTPLLRCASVGGNRDVALSLLMNGAEINAQDNDGKTALMIGIINGHQNLVELLLQRRADITVKNEYGKTAVEMAHSMDRRRIVKTLEEHLEKYGNKA